MDAERAIGPEVDDAGLLSIPVATAAAVLTNRELHGKRLGELAFDPNARGVYLQSLRRGPELIPKEPGTVIERGDILQIEFIHAGFFHRRSRLVGISMNARAHTSPDL